MIVKKIFLWILGVCVALTLASYVLLFTPLGNSLLKPLLQSKIDSLAPIKLEITEFVLKADSLHLVLQNNEYVHIALDGDFWIPSQEFSLNLNALVQDISIFGELVDTPMQGGFKLEAHGSGTFKNFEVLAKSDIAKSFSTLHMRFAHRQLHSIDTQIQEANIQEILAMLGHKPYIKGLLTLNAKFLKQDSHLEGMATATLPNGAFDTNALKKDFDIELEDTAFSVNLNAQTANDDITHTFAFASPIGTIHAQGKTLLPKTLTLIALHSLPIQSSFNLNLSNLAPFSPLIGRAIRGSLQSSGTIKGAGFKTLEIQGESDIASSQTNYTIALRDLNPLGFELHTKNAALEQLLWIFHFPPYANATLDMDLQASELDSMPTAKLLAKASGTFNADMKEFGIAFPRTPLALTLSGTFTGEQGTGEMNLISDTLQLEAQPITLHAHTLHSLYKLHIKDASKLSLPSGIKLNGALELAGELEFDKITSFTFSTHSLGGEMKGSYRDWQLDAQLDSLSSQKILALFGIPQVLQASVSGTFSYNTLGSFGTLALSGKEGKLTANKLSTDAMRFLGVDMTKETYQDISLYAKLDDAKLNAEFQLDSPNTHLSSKKTQLNLQNRLIDALMVLRIGKNEANVWLSEELANPNVRLEIKNLIIRSDEILKGLGNILNNKR